MRIELRDPQRCMLGAHNLKARCENEAVDTLTLDMGEGEIQIPICEEHLELPLRAARGQAMLATFRWGLTA